MGILDAFAGGDYDPEDDHLGAPLSAEATDLALHVERCAARYRQIRNAHHNNERHVVFNTALTVVLLLITLLTSGEKAVKALAAML